jgi:bacterioferritin-associated ferredoxin
VIVCHCRVVTDRAVTAALHAGAGSLAGVCRSTGAGQDCGSCVFAVRRLVCEHGQPTGSSTGSSTGLAATLTEVDVAAS